MIMCSRYSLHTQQQTLEQYFKIPFKDTSFHPRYNIAPFQKVLCIRDGNSATLEYLTWGIKMEGSGGGVINARSETVASKPLFSTAFRTQRCLIIADGFYEWQVRAKGPKQPYRICREDGSLFAFAGLWETWGDGGEDELLTCTIVTTEANRSLGKIHQRMPVILGEGDFSVWLDTTYDDSQALHKMLIPAIEGLLVAYPVSMLVNNVRNDRAACIAPLSALR